MEATKTKLKVLIAPLKGRIAVQTSLWSLSTKACLRMWPAERETANPASATHTQKR